MQTVKAVAQQRHSPNLALHYLSANIRQVAKLVFAQNIYRPLHNQVGAQRVIRDSSAYYRTRRS